MDAMTSTKPSARRRLLDAAAELFYAEGVQSVGIDRVIERAGVAKASLYHSFRSKDELVGAYLAERGESVFGRIDDRVAGYDTPRDRLLAVFETQAASIRRASYHGCPFAAAASEAKPDSLTREQVDLYRARLRARLTELSTATGVVDPASLALQLHFLYDGAAQSARLDEDREAGARTVYATAVVLVDQAISAA